MQEDITKEFRVVLFKLENYKAYGAYCEKYGDEKGDEVLEVLQSVVEQNLGENEEAIVLGRMEFSLFWKNRIIK